ncbi:MAG: hypothetical protein QNI84_13225 [Henriciella sp.]|nr:hypothetical protein [Henriciella sp.]
MTDLTETVERIDALFEKATRTPWAVRPQEHDDWGIIRPVEPDDKGLRLSVAQARAVGLLSDEQLNEHRQRGTDPYGPNANLIVELVNAWPLIRQALMSGELRAFAEKIVALEDRAEELVNRYHEAGLTKYVEETMCEALEENGIDSDERLVFDLAALARTALSAELKEA